MVERDMRSYNQVILAVLGVNEVFIMGKKGQFLGFFNQNYNWLPLVHKICSAVVKRMGSKGKFWTKWRLNDPILKKRKLF